MAANNSANDENGSEYRTAQTDVNGVPRSDGSGDADAEGRGARLASTYAYLAVEELSEAVDAGSVEFGQYIGDAINHLETGLDAAVPASETESRIESALEYLAELDRAAHDEQPVMVRDALADLAPVAAGVGDTDTALTKDAGDRPSVPVFYNVPPAAANRALQRAKRNYDPDGDPVRLLQEYLYEEIDEHPVIFVNGFTLAEYAARGGLGRTDWPEGEDGVGE